MSTLRFKTNVNCGGCIGTVTPFINRIPGIEHWEVDTKRVDRQLTVTGEDVTAEQIVQALEEAGYSAEPIPD